MGTPGRNRRVLTLLAFSISFIIFPFLHSSPTWAASASVNVVVGGDGGVVVTVSGAFESCTRCDSKGENCTITNYGSVSLYFGSSSIPGNPPVCGARGNGSASCSHTWDRGKLNGKHAFYGYASDCTGSVEEIYVLTLDNTPGVAITSPADGDILSAPFDITGTATFKPTLEPVKGTLDLYVDDTYWWNLRASKSCRSEVCSLSHEEIKGALLDFPHGGPHTIIMVASGGGARSITKTKFSMDKMPTVTINSPADGAILSASFDITGTATFKPTLDPVKGRIDLYIDSTATWYYLRASKSCLTESCSFSYQEIKDVLLDYPHGGPHTIYLLAYGGGTMALTQSKFSMDKMPTVSITSPTGTVSAPFDITGTATFKPVDGKVNGSIIVYLDGWYIYGAYKSCSTEVCSFSYREVMGKLYSLGNGGPRKIRMVASGSGASALDEESFSVVSCNLKAVNLSADMDTFDPYAAGAVNFSGTLSDDSNRTIQWKVNVGGQTLSGEGTSVLAAWDGKDSSGKLMEPDTYVATLTAQTAEGTCSAKETKSVPVTVESQPEDPCLLACFGSTVNLASGNLRHSQTLFPLPRSKLGSDFVLTYNSLDAQNSPLGTGWTHTYNVRLNENSNGSYTLVEGDGRRVALYSRGDRYTPKNSNYPALTVLEDDTATLEHKEGIFYFFDSVGKITAISDRNSNKVNLVYTDGNLTGITDPSERTISIGYDQDNRIQAITDPNGNVHSFSYTDGNLTALSSQVQQLGLQEWAYSYYSNGFLWTKTDPMGNKTEYFYDNQYRVARVIDPEGRAREVIYDPANFQTQFIEKDGGLWTYKYDPSLGVLKEKVDPLENPTSYTYYPDRNLKSVTDPRGYATSYTYDQNANVISVEDGSGHVTKYTYNSFNKVATIELDPKEPLIYFSYDERGNLIKVTDQMGIEREYGYDSRGNLSVIKNLLENLGLEYNQKDDLTSVKDLVSGLTLYEFEYDPVGNRVSTKEVQRTGQEAEKVTRFEYNGLNRVTKLTGPPPELNQTLYDYDLNGNIRSVIDGNGNPTWYEYNYQGKVSKITDALGYETYLKYGTGCPTCGAGVDKLTAVMDARKQTTTFEYDQAGNLGKETDPLGYSTSYKYDSAGNLYYRTDASGNTTYYYFDELNRLKEIKYPDQTTVAFTYDYRGNPKTAANANIAYTFAYDFNNRLTEVTDSNGRSISYRYNELGNRTRMVTPDGRVVEYKYDSWNHLSQVLVNSVPQANLVHDPYGRRLGLGYANGTGTSYSYNPSGYLTDLMTRDSQQATINSFGYTHDGVGNRKAMTDLNGLHGYDYDKIYQLIGAIHPNMPAESFQYDPVGNRLNTSVDLDNALLEDDDYTYAHDHNGNLIEKLSKATGEKTSYFYDFENRLVKVESPGLIAQYKYDPFGRRIEKNVNGTITRYTYDGPNILLESDGENNIKSSYLHTLAIDDLLAVEQGGKVYYYQKDGLGSVVALTEETGQVVQSYEYDSFGKIVNQAGSIRNPFTYTGREYDKETGLYFYRARYYDPNAGRFLTKDPIGFLSGDVNLYRYVQNNPINVTDPIGLDDSLFKKGVNLCEVYIRYIEKPFSPYTVAGGLVVSGGAAMVAGLVTVKAGVAIGPIGWVTLVPTGFVVSFAGATTFLVGVDIYLDQLRHKTAINLDLLPWVDLFPEGKKRSLKECTKKKDEVCSK